MRLYVDGCVLQNNLRHVTKFCGWAVVHESGDLMLGGSCLDATSNEMELEALVNALRWLERIHAGRAEILSDSQVVIDAVTNGSTCGRACRVQLHEARALMARLDGRVHIIKVGRRKNLADRAAARQAQLIQEFHANVLGKGKNDHLYRHRATSD